MSDQPAKTTRRELLRGALRGAVAVGLLAAAGRLLLGRGLGIPAHRDPRCPATGCGECPLEPHCKLPDAKRRRSDNART